MADVILFYPSIEQRGRKVVSATENSNYLGIGYLAAYLHQNGHQVRVLKEGTDLEGLLVREPQAVGFSTYAANYPPVIGLSSEVKRRFPKAKIILGGPHASSFHEDLRLNKNIDYIVVGEGEKTLLELVNVIERGGYPEAIKGIILKRNGSLVRTGRRERISSEELDSIDYRLVHSCFDYEHSAIHIPHSIPYSKMHFANISGSRGCWNDCSFCTSPSLWGRRIVFRAPNRIVDEIEFLAQEKGINYFFFTDDDFLVNGSWVSNIAREIVRRGLKTSYYVMASVHSADRYSDYALLKKSGCREITLGMESSSQQFLNEINKGYSILSLPQVANKIVSQGMHLGLFYMMGYPNQEEISLKEDYDFIKQLPFSRIRASFLTPFPGTRLYEIADKNDLWLEGCRNNWENMDCDSPMLKTKQAQKN